MCVCFYVLSLFCLFVLSDAYCHVSYSDAIDAEIGFVKLMCMLCYVMLCYVIAKIVHHYVSFLFLDWLCHHGICRWNKKDTVK
jgi:hypothetical protein